MSALIQKLANHLIAIALAVFLSGSCAYIQGQSLNLSSGSALKGSSLSLNLSLNAAASTPAGLQWTLSYPPNDITSLNIAAGPSLPATTKTLNCKSAAGSTTCLATGVNASPISSGVVAVVTATLSPTSNSTLDSLPLSNVMGVLPNGSPIGILGAGGAITVLPTNLTLQCIPATLTSGSASNCTVTLSMPAPAGGAVVGLSDNSAALNIPASVTVTAGSSTASFTAAAGAVTSNQFVTVTASLNGGASTSSLTIQPASAVAAVYAFDQGAGSTTADTSGNGNTGTISSATWTTSGKYGSALSFNGSNSSVTVNDSASLDLTSSVTLEAWVKPSSLSGWQTIMMKERPGGLIYGLWVNSSKNVPAAMIHTSTDVQVYGTTALVANTWTHMAMTSDGATVRLYVNGTQVSSQAFSGSMPVDPAPLRIGGNSVWGEYFNGVIDEARVYNRALSPAEIQTDMNTPINLVMASYNFNEGSGSTVIDSSAHGNTGTISGATWTSSGKYGSALSFNGSNSWVTVNDSASLDLTSGVTLEAWVKPSSLSGWQTIMMKEQPSGLIYGLWVNSSKNVPAAMVHTSTDVQVYGTTALAANTWTHMAMTSDGATVRLYVNGTQVSSQAFSGSMPVAAGPLRIGGNSVWGEYFKGAIDEVRVYNRALSQAEIQADSTAAIVNMLNQTAVTGTAATMAVDSGSHQQKPVNSPAPAAVSSLLCTPKIIDAGDQATCELRVAANRAPRQIRIASTSQQVKTPAVVLPRANQTRLTFQVSVDAVARQQLVTVTAMAGGTAVEDTIQVAAAYRPILTVPGSQMGKRGAPVRFRVAAVDMADLPVQLAASAVPAGASFDAVSGDFEWTPAAEQVGKYKVSFTAANAARQSSSAEVAIDVTAGDPTLANAERICSPGAIGFVRGSWLAGPGTALADPSGKAFDLGGTKAKVNGEYVPILSASPAQVQFLCPALHPDTRLEVAVETAAGVTEPLRMTMQSASPWIFTLGQNQGMVSFQGTTELAMARNFQVPAYPAQPGDEILLWGSGLDAAVESAPGTVSVKLGGVDAEVKSVRAVPGYPGVYTVQVRVPVPMVFGDAVPVELQVIGSDGKQFNSNRVTIAVEQAGQ